ncbi:MAG: beta-ketoacyl-ACP synthase II [Gemmatimonadales bacterium]
MRRVVITGIGIVSPVGNDETETWSALLAGKSGAAPIRSFDASNLDVRFGCEVKDFDPLNYMDKKEVRRADRFVHYAIAASEQAASNAGLLNGQLNSERAGVLIGSGIGGIATFEEQCRTFIEQGPSRVSPFFVPMFIPDMASGLVSIRFGAQGPNYCTVSACASSAHAIGEAYRLVQSATADIMIAGGAEAAITPLAMAGFSNMKALSKRNHEPAKASRPFDRGRDGFVMGDGAGIVVLESLERALDRGATIRSEIVGYGLSGDAYHMTQPAPGGRGAKQAMQNCLAEAKVEYSDIGYINTHGTSTPHGDLAEVNAIKDLFGAHAHEMVIGSTKSMTGHLLGGAGGLEAAICIRVLEEGKIPPTINQDDPDPECDINCAPNAMIEREVSVALSNSFGFGGHNVSLALKTYSEHA